MTNSSTVTIYGVSDDLAEIEVHGKVTANIEFDIDGGTDSVILITDTSFVEVLPTLDYWWKATIVSSLGNSIISREIDRPNDDGKDKGIEITILGDNLRIRKGSVQYVPKVLR